MAKDREDNLKLVNECGLEDESDTRGLYEGLFLGGDLEVEDLDQDSESIMDYQPTKGVDGGFN